MITLEGTTHKLCVHTMPPTPPVLFRCPYCERGVTAGRRVAYPPSAIGAYQPIYRCLCGKFFGVPIADDEE